MIFRFVSQAARVDLLTTPKAFANFSPRLERSDNLGIKSKMSD